MVYEVTIYGKFPWVNSPELWKCMENEGKTLERFH